MYRSTITIMVAALTLLATSATVRAEESHVFEGDGANVTVAQVSGVGLTVTKHDDGTYTCDGAFDAKKLFGKFNLYGQAQPNCAKGFECLVFGGSLFLGGMGGWPDSAATSFILSIMYDTTKHKALGVYHIGPLPGMGFHQYGVIDVTEKGK